ncbi:MAG: STAS domain-containing protein [Cellvibrionaceae bacterium]|nr:STAS domain-containing protein [Cellvibrionaceae bacterium]
MSAEPISIHCGETLNIASAADLQQQFNSALEKSSTIEIIADAVAKVDTAGLQLMVALNRELERSNGSLLWKTPSEVLLQAAASLGLINPVGLSEHFSKRNGE